MLGKLRLADLQAAARGIYDAKQCVSIWCQDVELKQHTGSAAALAAGTHKLAAAAALGKLAADRKETVFDSSADSSLLA